MEPNEWMLGFFALAGMFATMEGPAFDALIADSTKPAEREKVFSLSYLGHNIGFMFGIAVGGLLFENYLHLAFLFDGITTLMSTIMIVTMVKVVKTVDLEDHEKNDYEEDEHETKSALDILKDRKSVFTMIFVFFICSMIYNQWTFALPLYLVELFKEEGSAIYGYLGSFNGAIVVICTPILTSLMKKNTLSCQKLS